MLDIESLKASFSSASRLSEWATIVVVIGVVIEFFAVLFFSKDMSRAEKITLLVGSIFVVIGVGGEYIFGGRATAAAEQLQQLSDQKVAVLQRVQASDHRIASQAAAHAADLGVTVNNLQGFVSEKQRVASMQMSTLTRLVDTDRSRTVSAVATLNTDRATLQIARQDALAASDTATQDLMQMQKQVAKLDDLLGQEQALHERLEAVLTPRSLSADQQMALVRALKPIAPVSVDVILFGDTPEVGNFGRVLADTLSRSNWKVSLFSAVGAAAMSVQGVPILTRTGDATAKSAGNALEQALVSQRISARVVGRFSGTEIPAALVGGVWDGAADLHVYVGAKP